MGQRMMGSRVLTHLMRWWIHLRESVGTNMWFIPSVMVIGAGLLAFALVAVDRHYGDDWHSGWWLIFSGGRAGSREILSTVAGASITVLGVIFSITIVTISLAATQYSPRVLRSFMRDRGTQVVMGVFSGTFAYALLVMRTVIDAEDGPFVPHLAVTGAIVFGLMDIGAIVYFVHHVARMVQATNIIADIADETIPKVRHSWLDGVGQPTGSCPDPDGVISCTAIRAPSSGYVEAIDARRLLRLACRHNLLLDLRAGPGMYVDRGQSIILAKCSDAAAITDDVQEELAGAIVLAARRAMRHDALFGIRQIADVALRAQSPSLNDPTTACVCIDHMVSLLRVAAARPDPNPVRCDDNGHPRLVVPVPGFARSLGEAFDQIRHYGRNDAAVLARLTLAIGEIASAARGEHLPTLREHVRCLQAAIDNGRWDERELRLLRERAEEAGAAATRSPDVPPPQPSPTGS